MPTEPARGVEGACDRMRTGARVPDLEGARHILALLRADDVDAAIEAGLACFQPLPGLGDAGNAVLVDARDRLLVAWAARDRHRARQARLQRIADERRRARDARMPATATGSAAPAGTTPPPSTSASPGPTTPTGSGTDGPDTRPRPALPPAAAAALERARARAAGRTPS